MFAKLKKSWQRWRLDRRFRRQGIVGKNRKVEDSAIAAAADIEVVAMVFLYLIWIW